jgi:N-acetylneuraminic acid mutarotase
MKKNIFCYAITLLLFANGIEAQDNWNNQTPAIKPPAMLEHAMAYIGDDKVLVFGGEFGETWVYDLSDNNWTQKITTSKPSSFFYHAMAPIGDDQVLLYGGCGDLFDVIPLSETWVYDLSDNTWTQKTPSSNPSGRAQHALASLGGDEVLLFGGNGSGNDTWVYDLSANTWTLKNPTTSPSAVSGNSMANIDGDKVVLFGSNSSQNDTWVYDLSDNNWTLKTPATKPTGRQGHEIASIGGDKVLLFGGLEN